MIILGLRSRPYLLPLRQSPLPTKGHSVEFAASASSLFHTLCTLSVAARPPAGSQHTQRRVGLQAYGSGCYANRVCVRVCVCNGRNTVCPRTWPRAGMKINGYGFGPTDSTFRQHDNTSILINHRRRAGRTGREGSKGGEGAGGNMAGRPLTKLTLNVEQRFVQ